MPASESTLERMVRESRIELGPQISRIYADLDAWEIKTAVLEPAWETDLEARIRQGAGGEPHLPLDFDQLDAVRRVLVTSAALRAHMAHVLDTPGIRMDVLAIEEIRAACTAFARSPR